MKKIVFLQFLFLVVINSFAQTPSDTLCPFETVTIPNQVKNIEPSLNFGVNDVLQYKVDAYRNIFFIHGLGGDATAWTKAADACENLRMVMPFVCDWMRKCRPS